MPNKITKVYPPIVEVNQFKNYGKGNNAHFILHCPLQAWIEVYSIRDGQCQLARAINNLKQLKFKETSIVGFSTQQGLITNLNDFSLIQVDILNGQEQFITQLVSYDCNKFVNCTSLGKVYLHKYDSSVLSYQQILSDVFCLSALNSLTSIQIIQNSMLYPKDQNILQIGLIELQKGIRSNISMNQIYTNTFGILDINHSNIFCTYSNRSINLLDMRYKKSVIKTQLNNCLFASTQTCKMDYLCIDYIERNSIHRLDWRKIDNNKSIKIQIKKDSQEISWFKAWNWEGWQSNQGGIIYGGINNPSISIIDFQTQFQ